MTANRSFKRRVRARALRTGESYTTALRHLRKPPEGVTVSTPGPFLMATAQVDSATDPSDGRAIRRAGRDVRQLMSDACARGARLIHFGEGTLCAPDKHLLSSDATAVAAADWTRFDWALQREQLEAIAGHAADLRIWTVIGAAHRLTDPRRPYNSLYIIDEKGDVAARYDERMLSRTKISHMYTPGAGGVTFDVEGVRFGCALGMESQYPELFAEYERVGAHCVLLSTMDNGATFALQARAHASTNSYWVSYATHSADSGAAPAGIVDPSGAWAACCPAERTSAIVTAAIDRDHEPLARPWRRASRDRSHIDLAITEDPRAQRTSF